MNDNIFEATFYFGVFTLFYTDESHSQKWDDWKFHLFYFGKGIKSLQPWGAGLLEVQVGILGKQV